MKNISVFVLCALLGVPAFAQVKDLRPLPPHPRLSFDLDAQNPIPKCSEILSRMNRFKQISEEGYLAFVDFMYGSASIMQNWHETLSPLEGNSVLLPPQQFAPIAEGAESVIELTDLAYQVSNYMTEEIERIAQGIAKCLQPQ